MPQQKKSKLCWLRFAIPVVVVLLGAAVTIIRVLPSDTDRAVAGDCLNTKEFKTRAEPARVGCDDPNANVTVGERLGM